MSETWTKETCLKCQEVNWICHGDLNNLSHDDVDLSRCWKCLWVWTHIEDDELLDDYGITKLSDGKYEGGNLVDGKETPLKGQEIKKSKGSFARTVKRDPLSSEKET